MFRRKPRSVFVVAQPKSGSTHVEYVLAELLGLKHGESAHNQHADLASQQICPHHLPERRGFIYRQHLLGLANDVHYLKMRGFRPVITHRNVYDTVVSMRDQLASESGRVKAMPGLFCMEEFDGLSRGEQLTWVIRNWVPWYCQFKHSWRLAEKEAGLEVLWVDYDGFFADQVSGFRRILDWLGRSADDVLMEQLTRLKLWRFNKGYSRWRDELTLEHLGMISDIEGEL